MKIFIFLAALISIILTQQNSTAITSSSDTSYILLSSDDYDYKNPQFDKSGESINYYISDCVLAYEKWSSETSSKIAVRFMSHNSLGIEKELSDSLSLNIKPAVAYKIEQQTSTNNNPGAVVFQSNRNGNWDIYFSYYNSVNWSIPVQITTDTTDKTDPCIIPYSNNNLSFVVAYTKGKDIFLKNFFNGVWQNEVNITENDTADCISPTMTRAPISPGGYFQIAYTRINEVSNKSIYYHTFRINTDGTFDDLQSLSVLQQNSQSNLRFSNGVNFTILNYDYDTLGKKSYYSAFVKFNSYEIRNQTYEISGSNFCGTGSSHGDITSDFPGGYSVSSWINKNGDSTFIYVGDISSWQNTSKIYIGDSTVNSFLNSSTKLVFGNLYRVRILWEKEVNGRTALFETFVDNGLTSIKSQNEFNPENYYLSQNYPNPFNPKTIINYELQVTSDKFVNLKVFDVLGNEVATLVNEKQQAGSYNIEFDGSKLPSGIYFYRLNTDNFTEVKRMMLLK
ncbi:MAG: T9SS type A sorting domain-containing protein [Ignavibacteria bacterium]